jgi:hypothetical protein
VSDDEGKAAAAARRRRICHNVLRDYGPLATLSSSPLKKKLSTTRGQLGVNGSRK